MIPIESIAKVAERVQFVEGEREAFYRDLGYINPAVIDGKVCGLHPFMYTWAIVVGVDATGYSHRYCYDSLSAAMHAYLEWIFAGWDEPRCYIVRKGLGPDYSPDWGISVDEKKPGTVAGLE